ncbi:cell wall protein DAN4-like [Bombus pyrosoma]|uniref:cell wall protein DAN4-like n=1 Tax=Bombus pyrosoma TaxID=396416 RepID=UPI001CB9CF9C|nr:cell wall protein DAN4-like [Bombus pyrosoma]
MRALIFLFACLSLFATAWGNNLILGRRLFGDVLVEFRPILKPPVPGVSHTATIDITAPPGYVISLVSVINRNPRVVNIRLTKGYIGQDSMVLLATGRPGWALSMEVTVFAIRSKHHSTTTTSTTSSTTTSTQSTTTSTKPTTTSTQSTTISTKPTTTSTQSTIFTTPVTLTYYRYPGTGTPLTKDNQPASRIYRTNDYHIVKLLAPWKLNT